MLRIIRVFRVFRFSSALARVALMSLGRSANGRSEARRGTRRGTGMGATEDCGLDEVAALGPDHAGGSAARVTVF